MYFPFHVKERQKKDLSIVYFPVFFVCRFLSMSRQRYKSDAFFQSDEGA